VGPGRGSSRRQRRRRRNRLIALAVLGVFVWLGACAFVLAGVARHASQGEDLVEGIDTLRGGDIGDFVDAVRAGSSSGAVTPADGADPASTDAVSTDASGSDASGSDASGSDASDDIPDGETLAADLRAAAGEFRAAHDRASHPVLTPLTLLPVVGTQVKSVQGLSAAAATVGDAAADAVDSVATRLDSPTADPAARAEAASTAADALERFREQTADLDLGPVGGLVPPLARARDEFSSRLDDLDTTMATLVPASRGVAQFLTGPGEQVFFAANNAEMRAGSGMLLQAAPLQVAGGQFSFGTLEATDNMVLPTAVRSPDPDFERLWGFLGPGRDWRNLNLTPRFPVSAELATAMWSSSGRGEAEGVVVVDVFAVRELLAAVGPVEVTPPGGPPVTISADNVVDYLLLEQYRAFAGDRDARRDALGAVASAVLEAFNTREVSTADLLTAVQRAGRGGHLLAWSSDPVEQAGWEALEVDGGVGPETLSLALMNRGGNKLDQFVDISTKVTRRNDFAAGTPIRVEVTVTNNAPAGLPVYVGGPYPGATAVPGEYWGFLQLTVPAGSKVDPGDQRVIAKGPDGPSESMSTWVDLLAGETATYAFDVDLPAGVSALEIPPMARPAPATWDLFGETWKADRSREVTVG
jgi:hypothetical protein